MSTVFHRLEAMAGIVAQIQAAQIQAEAYKRGKTVDILNGTYSDFSVC